MGTEQLLLTSMNLDDEGTGSVNVTHAMSKGAEFAFSRLKNGCVWTDRTRRSSPSALSPRVPPTKATRLSVDMTQCAAVMRIVADTMVAEQMPILPSTSNLRTARNGNKAELSEVPPTTRGDRLRAGEAGGDGGGIDSDIDRDVNRDAVGVGVVVTGRGEKEGMETTLSGVGS